MKPIVFNYRQYEELREAYKTLLEETETLRRETEELKEQNNQMRIHIRILEEDRRQKDAADKI